MSAPSQALLKETHAAFRYLVEINGVSNAVFTECTLPTIEWEIEEIKEGGLNTTVHQLPGRRKAARLSLKNGIGKSQLLDWYLKTMEETILYKTITIKLLDAKHDEVMVWKINRAYPIKWTGPQLKADSNTIAIQSLDLACGQIEIS